MAHEIVSYVLTKLKCVRCKHFALGQEYYMKIKNEKKQQSHGDGDASESTNTPVFLHTHYIADGSRPAFITKCVRRQKKKQKTSPT